MRINLKCAASKACFNLVNCLAVNNKLSDSGIKKRVVNSVPKVNVFNFKFSTRIFTACLSPCNNLIAIAYFKFNLAVAISVNSNFCVISDDFRCNRNAGRTVKIKVKMIFSNSDKAYVPVNTAVKCKIRNLRINVIVRRVIGNNNKQIFVLNIIKLNPKG